MQQKELWSNALDQLAAQHFTIIDQFLPPDVLNSISKTFNEVEMEGEFHAAKVGAAADRQRISEIRSDFVFWLDRKRDEELEPFFEGMDELREQLSREFFLTLQGYEFHLAKYPEGAFYKPHFDQFEQRDNRQITFVLYLNPNWKVGDGGELVIHKETSIKVEPLLNRAVLFKSDTILHEVLPAKLARRSITGWLLKRPSGVGVLGL